MLMSLHESLVNTVTSDISDAKHSDSAHVCSAGWVCPANQTETKAILSTCGAETHGQSGPMFGDFSQLSYQISGQNKKSLNTFVSGKKDSHLSVGHSGPRPAPLYIRPIYLTQQTSTLKQHKEAICKTNKAAGWHWFYSFFCLQYAHQHVHLLTHDYSVVITTLLH